MGMYRRINILLLVVLLSLSNNASRDIVIPYTEDKLDLVSHSIIKIESDEDFINYGFPGNGAFDAPYLIENYNITVQNTSAIIISNTTQYFIVQNCYLKTPYTCISLFNLTEGTATIKNNICEYYYIRSEYQEFSVGIDIVEANQTTVNNNECKGMNYGIRLYESQDTIVNSNICDSTYFSALYTGSPIYDEIDGYGIYVEKSNDCIITQNICRNCSEVGILNRNSNRTIIEKNECYENGDDYCEICIKHENRGGILIEHSYQVIINQNQIERNIDNGIIIQDSENCEILNNTCYDDLWFNIHVVQTKNLTIYGNIFSGAGNGGFFHTMYESDISFNLFQNQSFYGIYLTNSANNSFHHNSVAYTNLAKSTTEESQAYDSGTRNDWHDENKLEGNWWSSWKRKKAYEIDGSANSIDPYPLEEPPILPTMRKPLNTERLIWALIISILSVGALVFVLYKKKIKPTQYDTISQDTDYYPQQQTYAQNVLAYCKYCGSKVDADSLHCSSCGKKIKTL